MTVILLPGPTNTHTIDVDVALVGTVPRIGLFDANGMLLDTSLHTYVSDAGTSVHTCQLALTLAASGQQLFVHAKQGSPITAWTPNAGNTTVTQSITIGPSAHDHPDGVASSFNIVVAPAWGAADAIWVDPTWPLSRAGSGGPKALAVPAQAASYFYLPSLGTSTSPVELEVYANVAVDDNMPYVWLSNAQGVCIGNTLVVCPPVGASTTDAVFCRVMLNAGTMPSGYAVTCNRNPLPTPINVDYSLSLALTTSFSLAVTQGGTTVASATFVIQGITQAPGPVWS